jgi:amino acid transporter
VAYLRGWTSFFGAIAAALLAFAGYISSLFPALGELDARLFAITTLWMLTAVHLGGLRLSGTLQTVLAAVTVMMMVVLIMSGFAIGPRALAIARSRSGPSTAVVLQSTWASFLILAFAVFERTVVYSTYAIAVHG